jgi:23S rRNA (cytosine1962-C5)-methyltransferase
VDKVKILLPDIGDGEDKTSPLKNRIRKNYRHIKKWAKRTQTNCFRVYDRDIREYPVAIDYYAGRFCVHYFAGSREDEEAPTELAAETENAIFSIFGAQQEDIYWRTRVKREKTQQYEKVAASKEFFIVLEYGVKFKVNLIDYLDTGLFLDHRETRQLVSSSAKDKRVLNLFAYTCSFSVHAAIKGAKYKKIVYISNT